MYVNWDLNSTLIKSDFFSWNNHLKYLREMTRFMVTNNIFSSSSFLLLHFLHLSCLLNPHSFFFMLTVWPLVQILLNTSYLAFTLSFRGFPGGSVVKNTPASAGDAGDAGSIPGSGRCSGGGHGDPLQYSCLGKPMDRGAWWAMVYVVAKSWTRLSDWALNLSFRNNYNSEWNILILPLYS